MSLEKTIEEKLSQSLKNKDKNTFPTLRLIISAIKDVKIAKKVKEGDLKDEDIVLILRKMVKQRNDSCDAYKKANREDLFNSEQKEIKIISEFLPKLKNEDETKKICESAIEKVKANSIKDMGKVMGILKSKNADTLDFSKVSSIIKDLLK